MKMLGFPEIATSNRFENLAVRLRVKDRFGYGDLFQE